MKKKHQSIIITFDTTADAMALESEFKTNLITGRLIPIPRQLSSGCGMAYKLNVEEKGRAIEIIKSSNLNINAIETLEI